MVCPPVCSFRNVFVSHDECHSLYLDTAQFVQDRNANQLAHPGILVHANLGKLPHHLAELDSSGQRSAHLGSGCNHCGANPAGHIRRAFTLSQDIVWILWAIPQFVDTAEFYRYFINSLIVSVGTVLVSVSIACFSGHALARYVGIGGIVLLIAALTLNSLPRMGYLLPYYWMGQRTGLYDTYILVIITMVAVNQPFSIWLLRGFFKDVPHEIEEAAMIDGASRFAAFVRVIFPIAWPGIFATGLLTLIIAYHEFLLVKILTLSNWTLSVAMAQFLPGISVAGSIPRQSAAAISATIPIVIVLLIFQKQLVKGLATGAVKG